MEKQEKIPEKQETAANKQQASPLNVIWLFMIVSATVVAAYNGRMTELTEASFESAQTAVELAIGLVGAMALWLGIMYVVEVAGGLRMIAQAIRPLMVRLFPDVPSDHPAMSAIIMNMAANALGLGNAATPMGLKAMKELDRINPEKGTATNAMCLFLAINTSSVTILPLGVIAVRAGAGASNPGSILIPSIVATFCSTVVAILATKLVIARSSSKSEPSSVEIPQETDSNNPLLEAIQEKLPDLVPPGKVGTTIFGGLILGFFGAVFFQLSQRGLPYLTTTDFFTSFSNWLIPTLICFLLLFGYFRGVKVYEALTEGAVEGFQIAIRIIPFLVAIFVAIGMFRASGALDLMAELVSPLTTLIGMPPEALPMVLIRPLSGGGSFGLMSELVTNDPDSFVSFLVSTMQGSTETTFYVLAVYFGSVGIVRSRFALPVALCADATGMLASLVICHIMF